MLSAEHWTTFSQHWQLKKYNKSIITYQFNKLHIPTVYISNWGCGCGTFVVDVSFLSFWNFSLPSQSLNRSENSCKRSIDINFFFRRKYQKQCYLHNLFSFAYCVSGCVLLYVPFQLVSVSSFFCLFEFEHLEKYTHNFLMDISKTNLNATNQSMEK